MPCRPAISSHSLGRAWVHDLPSKLDQASRYGLDIELFYEDLQYVAQEFPGGVTPQNLINASRVVRALCDERNLHIMCLQPFMHYEGIRDRKEHARRIEEMKLWIQMAKILGTNTVAIPSSFQPKDAVSGDFDLIVSDMQEIADLGAPEGLQFCFEALAWGTHIDTWEQTWDVVKAVDRPNFGLCLDTFNIAARVYADPAAADGKTPDADADIAASIERLMSTVDVKKIIYIQVVDGERLDEPLVEGHAFYDASQPARMSWSRNCRLFYGEEDRGAYLPVRAILEAILSDLGFEGWISAELFSRTLIDPSPSTPEDHARRAAESWKKMVRDFNLAPRPSFVTKRRYSAYNEPRAQL
ncbi:3-dehydroshikimate dehydratase [Polychaeton citri CBS 116435]|uniref:3-dehydroshikimate dehydratase n=1 Tax=Polychaeton citri CBS 116435 TaxID=1314669 RepID=A0A9P4QD13_9PEZI|nr:3-dehydroshikimate dehydratase [Polychaeton citri CBS 116435]